MFVYISIFIYIDRPQLIRHNETVLAKISDGVILRVTITSPTPALLYVRWYKDSQYISGNRYYDGTIRKPSLRIISVDATDDGTYTCEIYNGVGRESVDINLFTWSKWNLQTVIVLFQIRISRKV